MQYKPLLDFQNLPEKTREKINKLFDMMDKDKNGSLDKNETIRFWKNNIPHINSIEILLDVDTNEDNLISKDEWMEFWTKKIYNGDLQEVEERVIILIY